MWNFLETTTVKVPKVLIKHVKDKFGLSFSSNKIFVYALLISYLNDDEKASFMPEFGYENANILNKVIHYRSVFEYSDKTPKKKQNNQKLSEHFKRIEMNNEVIIGLLKLLMLDSGYSFPNDLKDRIDKFDETESQLVKLLMREGGVNE